MLQSLDRAFYRRLAVTAAALAAYRLGCHIPLPGVVPETAAQVFTGGGPALARVSVCALGIVPLVSALILAELVKTVAPGLRRWEWASPSNRARLWHVVVGLALLMGSVQALGVATGLEDFTGLVAEPGTSFRIVCAATLVAGTALVIGLAVLIDRAGLGGGVWLIFLAPTLAELATNLATITVAYEEGVYPLGGLVAGALFSVFAIAGVAAIVLAARGSEQVGAACIWPLMIAYALLAWLLLGLALAFAAGNVEQAMRFVVSDTAFREPILAVLVMLVTWLYVRSWRATGQPLGIPAAPIALLLAAISVLTGEILTSQFSVALPLGGVHLVVASVVATTMLIVWKVVGSGAQPPLSLPA